MNTERPSSRDPKAIREGDGGLPWWVWVAIAIWLVYALVIGPFNWLAPAG